MKDRMSIKEFRQLQTELQDREETASRSKFNNRKVVIDGIEFDSVKEGRFYGQCKIRKLAGEIKDFQLQVTFEIVVNEVKICDYRADMVLYYHDGRREIIDVKSEATRRLAVYKLKKKLMKAVHNLDIIEK